MSLVTALRAADAEGVAAELRRDEASDIAALEVIGQRMPVAPRPAARLLVRMLGHVVDEALPSVHVPAGVSLESAREYAILRGAEAALGGWSREYGFGIGVLGGTVTALRDLDPESAPLVAPSGTSPLMGLIRPVDFQAALMASLRDMAEPLDRIRDGLALDDTALAGLFGVKRQAVDQWRSRGIPVARRAAVLDVVTVVDLLVRKLRPGQLPLLAAKPVPALAGRTLIEALADDPAETRRAYEAAFDLSVSA